MPARPKREAVADDVVPYVQHVAEDVVLLDDGSRLAMFEVEGLPWETADAVDVSAAIGQLNIALRNIASERIILTVHVVRREAHASEYPAGTFRSHFGAEFDARYRAHVVPRLYRNETFLSVQMRPAMGPKQPGVLALLQRKRKDDASEVGREVAEKLEDVARTVAASLAAYGVRRLGCRRVGGRLFSEMAEALHLVLTGVRRKVPLPLANCRLGRVIYTDRAVAEWDTLRLRGEGGTRYAAVLGLREYPMAPDAWDGDRPVHTPYFPLLLSAPYHFVLTQSFGFMSKPGGSVVLTRKQNQMTSVSDRAYSQRDALTEAADKLAGNVWVMGTHHLSLMVLADTRRALAEVASQARADLADGGAVVAREDAALEAAYWAQLPGNAWLRPRPAAITSLNFAGMAPLHAYPRGPERGYWGAPAMLFRTNGGTPYRYHLHVGDLGNTAMFGPSGSGKTTLLLSILAQSERLGARAVLFDKDRGGEILARAMGGTYLVLPSGEPTGLAPLRALDGSPANVEFLTRWVGSLICADGEYTLTPDDERRIAQGVAALMRLPPAVRSLGELRAFLGQTDPAGAGARLEKWCRGRALGWAFDGEEDRVSLDAPFLGFDMTALLDDADVRGPAMAYLFHRVEALVDGRRLLVAIDEFWKALADEAFRELVNDKLKTIRKRNGALLLATQSPRDALRSPIAHTLIEQCPTQILMPNPRADAADYRDGLKLTEPEFRMVKDDLTSGHRFLLKQGVTSVACDLHLTGMDDVIAVLSGRESTVRLMERAVADAGGRPDDWLPEFHRRIKEAAA